ncbi:MAG: hypothetical protein ACLPQ0_16620 [Candidatus Binatus sp.]
MLITPLFSTALILAVATDPLRDAPGRVNLTTQEKITATELLVRSATRCITRTVIADPRYGGKAVGILGDLIVNSMPTCLTPVQAMIDAYDRYYGEGSGKAFFMGPYLDALPKAIAAAAKTPRSRFSGKPGSSARLQP